MTFRGVLQRLVEETPGALGAALMASDGIAVDEFVSDGSLDLSAVAVELQGVLDQTMKAGTVLADGKADGLREFLLVAGDRQLFFRPVEDDLWLMVVLSASGMLGKARFLSAQVLQDLRACL